MATADEEAMEGCRGGFEVEGATSPVGTVSVGGEGHGRRVGVFAHHKGGGVGVGRVPPEDRGEEESGEEGGPGPP